MRRYTPVRAPDRLPHCALPALAGRRDLRQELPQGAPAARPGSEGAPVGEVHVQLRGEGCAAGGEASVGDDQDDVGAVELAGGAVDALEVGGADRGAAVSVAAVLYLDDPGAAEWVGGQDVGAVVKPPICRASVHPSRRIRSRMAYSKSRWCRASSCGSP